MVNVAICLIYSADTYLGLLMLNLVDLFDLGVTALATEKNWNK